MNGKEYHATFEMLVRVLAGSSGRWVNLISTDLGIAKPNFYVVGSRAQRSTACIHSRSNNDFDWNCRASRASATCGSGNRTSDSQRMSCNEIEILRTC